MYLPGSKLIDPEYLSTVLDYDKDLGVIYWKERPRTDFRLSSRWHQWNRKFKGKRAGSFDLSSGRLKVSLFGKTHDLALLLAVILEMKEIYFKNGQTVDFHPDNLIEYKEVTSYATFDNSYLICGPSMNGGHCVKGGPKLFGIFRTFKEANQDMLELADKLQVPFETTEEIIFW
ncbi:MAG: hypothetical protein KatS3mg087_1408 [Patescibacteria group bacterium]|nr:MAG: hypothetical protein KatS3mg087_1408 [Patescibacteria group bacterium]